jgi:protein ImuB
LAQRALFLPITPEAEKLEVTLARINGIVGERRAGIAKVLDTHRPDAFRMERFVVQPESGSSTAGLTTSDSAETPILALRILRPPRQVRVQLAEGRPGRLAMLARNGERVDFYGTVLWSAGPWRSSGDWWAEQPKAGDSKEDAQDWDREEWDVALAQGDENSVVLYRIYRDIGTGRWFADASYD